MGAQVALREVGGEILVVETQHYVDNEVGLRVRISEKVIGIRQPREEGERERRLRNARTGLMPRGRTWPSDAK